MEAVYEVYLGSKAVGRVEVRREGLYYRFRCRCNLPEESVCRISVTCGDRQASLGVLVPEGGGFALTTRLPVKQLGEGEMRFQILPRHESVRGKFVPISPEEPFAYLARLKEAFLARQGDCIGAVIPTETGTE